MAARVLVVDDVPRNVTLLADILTAAHFRVETAFAGEECLRKIEESCPDIVLLDVMMPGMNGFEVCRRIKADPRNGHLPVVMVTALDRQSDRLEGLRAGADDFLTKPVDTAVLMARTRGLVRLKMMQDEMLLRHKTLEDMGVAREATMPPSGDSILLIDDLPHAEESLRRMLPACTVIAELDPAYARLRLGARNIDLVLLSLDARAFDPLSLLAELRSLPAGACPPVLALGDPGRRERVVRALDLGADDFIATPLDEAELQARVRTQRRKRRLARHVASNVRLSLNAVTTDPLTGLHNRIFITRHIDNRFASQAADAPLALVALKIDGHAALIARHGREAGDGALQALAECIRRAIRGGDIAARSDIDAALIAMPDTSLAAATSVAEQLRVAMAASAIALGEGELRATLSVGVVAFDPARDDCARSLIARAENAAVEASRSGPNRLVAVAA